MATTTIIDPPAQTGTARAIAARWGQPLRFEVSTAATNWWAQTNGGAWVKLNTVGGTTQTFVWAPPAITRRFTFDTVRVAAQTADPTPSLDGDYRDFDVCEGPVATLQVTDSIRNEALQEPLSRPDDIVTDDPPLAFPLAMPPANRDGFGTVRLESPVEQSGPANLASVFSSGLFLDTEGRLGSRTPLARVRGLGAWPTVASYHYGAFYFEYDFGSARTISLTRVLFTDAANNVAIVRGDGRRNTYRNNAGVYTAAASIQNQLTQSGTTYREITPAVTYYYFVFDSTSSRNRLTQIVDRYGNTVYYNYDTTGRLQQLTSVPDAAGLLPYLAYDTNGLLINLTLRDPSTASNNRTAYFVYNTPTDRNLLKIIGPELCNTYFTYGSGNQPSDHIARVTDSEGFSWGAYYAQDAAAPSAWRTVYVTDALGNNTYFAYDVSTAGPTTAWRDRAEKITYFKYNAFGSPTVAANLSAAGDYYRYDGAGNLISVQNRLVRNWYYQYDAQQNRISSTDPFLARSYFAYDTSNNLRFTIDELGRFTYLEYDSRRNRTTQRDALGNTTYWGFQSTGLVQFRKDRRGNFTYLGFDSRANLASVHDAFGFGTYYAYNSAGERTAMVDALGRIAYYEFDKRGRMILSRDAAGGFRYFVYDDRCNTTIEVDARGNPTYHVYDGNANRFFTKDAVGNLTYIGYDAEDRVNRRRDARGNTTYWSYDALGRRQTQKDPFGNLRYWGYDAAHELERCSPAA